MTSSIGLAFGPKQKVARDSFDPVPRNHASFLALITATAFSVFGGIMDRSDLGVVGAMNIFFISLVAFWTRNVVSKFSGRSALVYRLLFGVIACAAILPTVGCPDPDTGEVQTGVIFSMFLFDWRFMTSTLRRQRLSLPISLGAGFVAWLVAVIAGAGDEAVVAGISVAGIALTLQVLCPFDAKSAKRFEGSPGWMSSILDAMTIGLEPREAQHAASSVNEASAEKANYPELQHDSTVSPFGRGFALFLSVLPIPGLHRIYVGRVASGLVWCLTGGMFVIGQIVDFIKILFGRFRDRQQRLIRV